MQSSEDIRRQIHGRPKPSAHMQAARALELVATALRKNKPLPEGITIGADGSVQFKVERFEGSCKPL